MRHARMKAGPQITKTTLPYKDHGTIFVTKASKANKNLLALLPGQSLSPLMFFDFPIYPDGTTISDKILSNGFDILYIEPVGYCRGQGMVKPLYTRDHLAEQLNIVLELFAEDYDKIVTSSFCSTTHAPLIAAKTFPVDGIFILSPIFGDPNHEFAKKYMKLKEKPWPDKELIFSNSLENFIKNRLEDRSDSLIGGNHRVADWEEKFVDRLQDILPENEPGKWTAVTDMLYDLWLYPANHGNQGWVAEDIPCRVLCVRGQYDYESNDQRFDVVCRTLGNKVIPVTIENTSHFGMWEHNYNEWANEVVNGLKLLTD